MIELNTKAGSFVFSAVFAFVLSTVASFDTVHAQGVHNLDTGESFTTITEAIDDADTLNGHTLSVDPGTYSENIYVSKELTIQSTSGDPQDTVLHGNAEFVIEVRAPSVTIDAFTIQSNNQAGGVGVGHSYCTISNCIIRDNQEGIGGWPQVLETYTSILNNLIFNCSRHGIEIHRSHNSIISGNTVTTVTGHMFGIWVNRSDDVTVSSNIIKSNSGVGLTVYYGERITITDNVIRDNNEEGLELYYPKNVTMTGNEIYGNEYNLTIGTGYQSPVYFQHDIDSTNTVDGKPVYYYLNQQGVQVPADAGFVACVGCDGVVGENLTLADNGTGLLLVQTQNATFTNIDMSHGYEGIVTRECLDSTFSRITISDFEDGTYFHNSANLEVDECEVTSCEVAIRISESNFNVISNCLIEDNDNGSIRMSNGQGNLVEGNIFRQNETSGATMSTWSVYNRISDNSFEQNSIIKIWANESPHNEIIGNYVDGSENYYHGIITVTETTNTLISGNTLQNGTQYGIWMDEASGCTVEGNMLSQFSEEPAIWMESANSNIIRNNTLRDCQYGLQLLTSDDNQIEGNIFSYIWRGMLLETAHYNVITNNSFLECTDIELMLDASDNNEVYHNDFLATTLRVYDVGANNTWDNGYPSGGNYWSTYNGTDLDGDGIGDTQIEVLPAGNSNYDRYPLMTPANLTFFTEKATLSEATGGQINLYAEAGHANAFRKYLVVGGLSGTDPGQPLPGGLATIPVNFDAFTHYVVFPYLNTVLFTNFLGILDEDGRAQPVINAPPVPGFAGNTMHYAFCCNNPFDFASNAVAIEIVP